MKSYDFKQRTIMIQYFARHSHKSMSFPWKTGRKKNLPNDPWSARFSASLHDLFLQTATLLRDYNPYEDSN